MFYKHSVIINAASSKSWGTSLSTQNFDGEITAFQYSGSSTPLNANSSAVILIRRGSTTGAILGRSSSGVNTAARMYYPRGPVKGSTGGASSGLNALIPLKGDKLSIIRKEASSSGPTMGAVVDVWVKGHN